MDTLKDKNIILCVTGSIAAYKACELLRLLRKEEANVQVIMSKTAENFIGKATFAALSNNQVLTNLFDAFLIYLYNNSLLFLGLYALHISVL